jgi:AcrR family transcriptional regulator
MPPSNSLRPKGMADVTVNKVSELADVTKGAFFNHFDGKETLVTELMQMLLTRLDQQFDRLLAGEKNSDGCFTRAYIRAAFSEGAAERKIWGALLSLMAFRTGRLRSVGTSISTTRIR